MFFSSPVCISHYRYDKYEIIIIPVTKVQISASTAGAFHSQCIPQPVHSVQCLATLQDYTAILVDSKWKLVLNIHTTSVVYK